jgi:hypothetical protein
VSCRRVPPSRPNGITGLSSKSTSNESSDSLSDCSFEGSHVGVVWIDSAGVASAESRFSISVDGARPLFNELVQNLHETPWISLVLTPCSPGELQEELQKLLFSVSLFFESPSRRKVSKIIALQLIKIFVQNSCKFTALRVNSALR